MNLRDQQLLATRRAILDALGALIAESGTGGFSVEDVAKRAGVTHRTVYNHFPTREALNDAFAVHVEELLEGQLRARPDEGLTLDRLPEMSRVLYPLLAANEAPLRAYVMLMVASRAPAKVAAERSERFQRLLQDELGPMPSEEAQAIVAALRMFASTTGWHLLTEHHGLSHANAERTASWAVRVLLEAVSRGDVPNLEPTDASDDR